MLRMFDNKNSCLKCGAGWYAVSFRYIPEADRMYRKCMLCKADWLELPKTEGMIDESEQDNRKLLNE